MSQTPEHGKTKARPRELHPFLTPEERLAVWRKLRGMWKGRAPNPAKAFKKIREDWDRPLPPR
jgi:hypothetical protein